MTPKADSMGIILGIFGLGNLLNGAWMLADPPHWYETLPAGVPDFGPLNEHFVRDIGSIFFLMGGALIYAAARPRARLPVVVGVAGFHVLHAVVHVFDTVRGAVGPEHWAIDFPGVYLPALLLVGLGGWIWKSDPT